MAMAPAQMQGLREQVREALMGGRKVRLSDLKEALTSSEMSVLLQDGLRTILFNSFAGTPTTWQEFIPTESSDKELETWMELGRLGTLNRVGEAEPYRQARPDLLPEKQIRNFKYGDIFEVTDEMLRFDRTGLIRQLPDDQGRRAAQTREEQAYLVLMTGGNYTKTSADNDVGNNTGATTFGPAGLIVALETLETMKDPISGRYLGVKPDTLIVSSGLRFAAQQLLNSPNLQQVAGGSADASIRDVYGGGTSNPFRGIIDRIIVSPEVRRQGGQWQWVLCERGRFMVHQEVDPLQLLNRDQANALNEGYFMADIFSYRVRLWFGMGMKDDRFAYLSTSSTAPVMA